jgi:hypothetical protein
MATDSKEDEIIEVISQRYSSDWVYDEVHKIKLKEILGFELHYRGDSWHVVVVTNQETKNENIYAPQYYSYDLSHWVFSGEAKKLLHNPSVKILKIVNYWSSKDFGKILGELYK